MPVRRVYFVLGEILTPNGGGHVIIDFAQRLAASGRDVAMLYTRPDYEYPFAQCPDTGAWSPRLTDLRKRAHRRVDAVVSFAKVNWDRLKRPTRWSLYEPKGSDILVVPEYRYPEIMAAFPDQDAVVLVQDVYGFLNAFSRDHANGTHHIEKAAAVLTTSDACAEAMSMIAPKFHGRLQVDIDRDLFQYVEDKKFQIAYMPRKRRDETVVFEALMRSDCPDVPLVPIDSVSREEAARLISESLFFASFSEREGFGLPPAEAMASGSIVVGYTGVGGNEYFDAKSGFPIEDANIISLVRKLEDLADEYQSDPVRLDRMRKAASEFILRKYDKKVASSQLIATWSALEKQFGQVETIDALSAVPSLS